MHTLNWCMIDTESQVGMLRSVHPGLYDISTAPTEDARESGNSARKLN